MNSRRLQLIFALFAFVALLGLAAGLHAVRLQPAEWERVVQARAMQAPAGFSWATVFFVVLFIGLTGMVWFIASAKARQSFAAPSSWSRWRTFIRGLIALAMFLWIYKNYDRLGLTHLDFGAPISAVTSAVQDAGTTAFIPPTAPPAVTYLLSFSLAVLTLGLLWLFGRRFFLARSSPADGGSLAAIATAARTSLTDLSVSQNWEDAILRAYLRMTEAVARAQGLHRQQAMTAGEFALRLQQAGLPREPVRRLTGLFESVRYGRLSADARERQEAADCLTTILRACGEAA